ncbi:MAG: protein translocase subunit SecD [Deltaproteobacteria bacterium]|nr:protein translocase subunit SecD [Deltaproteobacteria bacterium]
MNRSLRWRIVLTVCVALLAIAYVLPTFPSLVTDGLKRILPERQISLGLDLKGGMHLTLGVDVKKAVANSMAQTGRNLRDEAREQKIAVFRPEVTPEGMLTFALLKKDQQKQLEDLLAASFRQVQIVNRADEGNDRMVYSLALKPEDQTNLEKLTIEQAVKTIRNRIDQFGVSEPDIRRQQDNRIQVQLPGLDDPERAIQIIGKTAHLEFMLVDDTADVSKAVQGVLPPGDALYFLHKKLADGTISKQPMVLKSEVVLTGEYITDARTQFDSYGQPYVSLNFSDRGAKIFERITAENVKKRLAIVLDGAIYSAPVIQEKIGGGRASISGQFTTDEAHDLALVLRAGSLPAPVEILEERTIGPSLGQESIDKGVLSALIGGALILVFMIVYYGFAGIIADIALIFNILLIMAGLAGFGATLTLPGIAGIILTIGMAVDANVLIFERIREELRKGFSPRAAVDEGYSRATLTILDANVTTIIAAVVLYQFGTGPIRGFAVTLTLGILASMFTALFVSRILFDYWLKKRPANAALSI